MAQSWAEKRIECYAYGSLHIHSFYCIGLVYPVDGFFFDLLLPSSLASGDCFHFSDLAETFGPGDGGEIWTESRSCHWPALFFGDWGGGFFPLGGWGRSDPADQGIERSVYGVA